MFATLSATEVGFAMAGLVQGVLALAWIVAAWRFRETRRACAHWAGYAGYSALSFVFLIHALGLPGPQPAESWRAAGNVCGVLAFVALQRGIWAFVGRPLTHTLHIACLALVLLASWIGLSPEHGAVRVGVNTAVQAVLGFGMAYDLFRHARSEMRLRWPLLLAVPIGLGSVLIALRGLRAVTVPGSVTAEMAADSGLNIAASFSYVALALTFHATLMAMVVSRLVRRLRHHSRHDALTGLLNRRALEEALQAQVQSSRRSAEPFVAMMFDLDHFKAINDRHGHAVGDQALQHASALLLSGMRDVDRLARWGGEEFLAILPGATLASAHGVAERLREQLAARPLRSGEQEVALSMSVGLAQWLGREDDPAQMLQRADAALYRAKAGGRNRVELQADLSAAQGMLGLA